ncbi:hypothetical protein GGF46_005016 [Coemansia sp. RSA 552]|nr:hypothetical protein GGF46_005016 [Coemansia sp. RSA 552]
MVTSLSFEPKTAASTSSVLPESARAGILDIVSQGPTKRVDDELSVGHPLESRLANWESSQLGMKLHMQRQVYGLHAPLRTMMEIRAVEQTPSVLGSRASRIQRDILLGKDETIDVCDIFGGPAEDDTASVHQMLAARLHV